MASDPDRAVQRLTAAVLSVKPLADELTAPIRVAAPDRLAGLLDRVARHAGVRGLTPVPDAGDLGVFERVISDRLALADAAGPRATAAEIDRAAAAAVADGFDTVFAKRTIAAEDGVPLNVYGAGRGDPAVVLVPASGMPAALIRPWLTALSRDRRVVTWETRGLFGPVERDDFAVDIDAQARDLFTVMDHAGLSGAHVIALCGGAMIALAAAAAQPGRIASLSLWHGAYGFAGDYPTTRHQHDLIELMTLAAGGRGAARAIQTTFCRLALDGTPREVAHLVLYPFAGPDLFYRYCRVNTALTGAAVEHYLDRVKQPTLVVTSLDDVTAHPDGSRRVAHGLPNAQLRVEAHGDHISLFQGDGALIRVAAGFIDDCPGFP